MLSSFKIKNFKSILEETISLQYAEGKAPNGYKESELIPFLEAGKTRLVPCLMFFGPNASGKSNLLEALFVFQRIVFHGIANNFIPNKLNHKFATTLFELEFFIAKNKYRYLLEYNQDQIVRERLDKNGALFYEINNKQTNFKKIELKGYTETDFKNLLEVECSVIKDNVRLQQATFLSKVATNDPGLDESLADAIDYFKSKLKVYSNNEVHPSLALNELAKEDTDASIQDGFRRIAVLMQTLDIDIDNFALSRVVKKINKGETMQVSPSAFVKADKDGVITIDDITAQHKDINNKLVDFKFTEESSGTRILFGLIARFLRVLEQGITLVVDELDRSLHPVLLTQLIRIFKDKRYNKNGAQLIFTTHTTDILDDDIVRMSEVGIVSKTLKSGTTLKRLSDFEDVRNIHNFRKQYLEGRFAGIPLSYVSAANL